MNDKVKEKRTRSNNNPGTLSRRDFLRTSAVATGLVATGKLFGTPLILSSPGQGKPVMPSDELRVALIGAGEQGRILLDCCLRIPGIKIAAICDIWEYSRTYASGYVRKYGQNPAVYEDYRQMLDREKDLDAVIVATPDWVHAEQTNACLNHGLHVYCEKEMSNSLEKARSMVETARRTGKLLQIGHQRRSNPRYIHAIEKLIGERKILGRVMIAYAQWNRAKADMLGWPRKYTIDPQTLHKYGYNSMEEFRNWRWFKKYGGGPIVDLGSHQIDLFSWVFKANPRTVVASGGIDYYQKREWYDNVMVIYEYYTPEGPARAFYQVQTTTSHGGFYETFMGDNGSLVISEVPQKGNWAYREAHAPDWEPLVREGLIQSEAPPIQKIETRNVFVDVRVTAEAGRWPLPVELAKPAHQPHLENFFEAIRRGIPLNCPAELAYETAVAVLRVNEAVRNKTLLRFNPSDFKA
ncbi:MAG: Gfo/Idh/MocA family oxidoreductase [Candidatus Saccharicenans sp.]|uniref:Gfo/Idh/MocA family oxidoreductase n=1 Tax=Candidatus Saccharicenans sp. TaxID=2819258 RepID=UPI00404A04F9